MPIHLFTLKFPTWGFALKARGCPEQGTSRLLHAFAGNDEDDEEDDDDLLDIVEERNSRHGSGGLSPERGGILGSVI